jgi:hypothetical protein
MRCGFIESFNARLRDELLDGEIFYSLNEARTVIESCRRHYNRASEHPSVYVIEGKRLCWLGCDPVGYFGFCRARSVNVSQACKMLGYSRDSFYR